MFSRQFLNVGQILRSARMSTAIPRAPLRNASEKSKAYANGSDHLTMNDLPVPEGDWFEDYKRKNLKNTLILITGICTFTCAVYMHATDEAVNLNWKVPEYDRCK